VHSSSGCVCVVQLHAPLSGLLRRTHLISVVSRYTPERDCEINLLR
jgi:hypothetical protein